MANHPATINKTANTRNIFGVTELGFIERSSPAACAEAEPYGYASLRTLYRKRCELLAPHRTSWEERKCPHPLRTKFTLRASKKLVASGVGNIRRSPEGRPNVAQRFSAGDENQNRNESRRDGTTSPEPARRA